MTAPLTRRQRRIAVICAVIAVVAGVVAVIGFIGAGRGRPVPDDTTRQAILAATEDAVGAIMTFGPDPDTAARDDVARRLTGTLLTRYRAEGNDVVLPLARESGASMSVQVVGVGLDRYSGDAARVLVFADQQISIPALAQADSRDGRASVVRWAAMRKVDGKWRLAELDVAGDATR